MLRRSLLRTLLILPGLTLDLPQAKARNLEPKMAGPDLPYDGFLSISDLADAFARIERHNVRVEEIHLSVHVWTALACSEPFFWNSDWANAMDTSKPQVVWGAKVIFQDALHEEVRFAGTHRGKPMIQRLVASGKTRKVTLSPIIQEAPLTTVFLYLCFYPIEILLDDMVEEIHMSPARFQELTESDTEGQIGRFGEYILFAGALIILEERDDILLVSDMDAKQIVRSANFPMGPSRRGEGLA